MPVLLNTAKKVEKIFSLRYIILYAKEMRKMTEQITAVQKMQEYIEANLDSDITMADLAGVSCFSPWHAYRLFKNLTGFTPAEYIRRLRLSRSAMKLKNEGWRLSLALAALTDIRGAFTENSAVTPGSMPEILFLFHCSFPTALNSESSERRKSR